MSRRTLALPLAAGLLALVAACGSSKSGTDDGAGALQSAPPSAPAGSAGNGQGNTPPATHNGSGGGSGSGTGSGTGSGSGGGSGSGSGSGSSSSDWPSPADCVSYNPNNLTLEGTAAGGTFQVLDGQTVVIRVHGQTDDVGQNALALAQRYTRHCYIGRNNNRDPRGDYIFDYWRNPTGKGTLITDEDQNCSPYNNKNLTVEDMGGGDGWRVKDHDNPLQLFDNGTDARNGDIVFKKYTQACHIGDAEESDGNLGQVDYQR